VPPRYDQKAFDPEAAKNNLLTIVSPMGEKEGVNIHQNAWFSLGKLDKDFTTTYQLKDKNNGVYAFVIDGDIAINGEKLNRRDALGLVDAGELEIKAESEAELLLMEIPMQLK